MIRILLLLLALLFAPAPDPHLTALWDSDHSATIQWTQTARGCLSVRHATGETVFLLCSERYPATIRIELGHGTTDGTARPASGDVYFVDIAGQTTSAPLRGRSVYLPTIRR